MVPIDVFAHVLPERFYARMLAIEPSIPERYAFFNNPVLTDMAARRAHWDGLTKQVISFVNALPEDYVGPDEAAALCWEGNEELLQMRRADPDMFEAAVLMVPMNNIGEAVRIVREQVLPNEDAVGVQVFTRALDKSIADDEFRPLFAELAATGVGAWLHPVFDLRKPDNNIVFSWEYELTLADFRRFYADTAILGNTAALELAVDYYGADHVVFGTDAPLGILPAGATAEIRAAIDAMDVADDVRQAIYEGNYRRLIGA